MNTVLHLENKSNKQIIVSVICTYHCVLSAVSKKAINNCLPQQKFQHKHSDAIILWWGSYGKITIVEGNNKCLCFTFPIKKVFVLKE